MAENIFDGATVLDEGLCEKLIAELESHASQGANVLNLLQPPRRPSTIGSDDRHGIQGSWAPIIAIRFQHRASRDVGWEYHCAETYPPHLHVDPWSWYQSNDASVLRAWLHDWIASNYRGGRMARYLSYPTIRIDIPVLDVCGPKYNGFLRDYEDDEHHVVNVYTDTYASPQGDHDARLRDVGSPTTAHRQNPLQALNAHTSRIISVHYTYSGLRRCAQIATAPNDDAVMESIEWFREHLQASRWHQVPGAAITATVTEVGCGFIYNTYLASYDAESEAPKTPGTYRIAVWAGY